MSTRLTILRTLIKHGQSTYDDLELNTGIARDKLRIAINDAKKAGHVDLKKDEPTRLPAYSITPDGRAWVKKNGTSAADFAQEAREAGQELAKAEQKPEKAPIPTALTVAPRHHATHDDLTDYQMTIDQLKNENAKRRNELDASRNEAVKLSGLVFRIAEQLGGAEGDDVEALLTEVLRDRIRDKHQIKGMEDQLVKVIDHSNQAIARVIELEGIHKVSCVIGTLEPAGYLVATPKKLRRFKKEATAQAQALAHARAKGTAEVFTLYPAGKAIRGAEWKPTGTGQ